MKRGGFIAWLGLDRPEETRLCPHCDVTIPAVENVCPHCHRILRYEGIEELRRLRSDKPGTLPADKPGPLLADKPGTLPAGKPGPFRAGKTGEAA